MGVVEFTANGVIYGFGEGIGVLVGWGWEFSAWADGDEVGVEGMVEVSLCEVHLERDLMCESASERAMDRWRGEGGEVGERIARRSSKM